MIISAVSALPLNNVMKTLYEGEDLTRSRRDFQEVDMCSYRMQNITRLAETAGQIFVSTNPIQSSDWSNRAKINQIFRWRSTIPRFTEKHETMFPLWTWNSLVFIDPTHHINLLFLIEKKNKIFLEIF